MDYINVIANVMYLILNIFPDFFKWGMILFLTLGIFLIRKNSMDSFENFLLYIFGICMTLFLWIGYLNIEVFGKNISIFNWFISIPTSIYDFILDNRYIIAFLLFGLIGSFISYIKKTEPDNGRADTFSTSELKAFKAAEHIKKVRNNLR